LSPRTPSAPERFLSAPIIPTSGLAALIVFRARWG
jgi:hypothetical protein